MSCTTFAVPIVPGKTEAWKAALAEMSGPRRADYDAARRALVITREVVSLQETPQGDFVCVFIEGADAENALAKVISATDDFHEWVRQTILADTHGVDLDAPPPPGNTVFKA